MIVIAHNKSTLNVNSLVSKTGYSRNHTAKILNTLVKNNFLTSERGPSGGFVLKRKAEEICLLELYELFEGKITTYICNHNCRQCPIKSCIFGDLTQRFFDDFKNYLNNNTINSIII